MIALCPERMRLFLKDFIAYASVCYLMRSVSGVAAVLLESDLLIKGLRESEEKRGGGGFFDWTHKSRPW